MSLVKIIDGGNDGYSGGKEIWNRSTAGAYGPSSRISKRTIIAYIISDHEPLRTQIIPNHCVGSPGFKVRYTPSGHFCLRLALQTSCEQHIACDLRFRYSLFKQYVLLVIVSP